MNIMKAAVYFQPGKPDVLHYRDVPLPVCGPDDVLVKIEAIALEGGDVINRATAVPGPEGSVPGYSAAGSIVAVGVNVKERIPANGSRPLPLQALTQNIAWPLPHGPGLFRKGWMWPLLRSSRSVLVRLRERCFRA